VKLIAIFSELSFARFAVGEYNGNIHFAFGSDGQWLHYVLPSGGEPFALMPATSGHF
jgi:hypothetical protein